MGRDKALLEVGGETLLARVLRGLEIPNVPRYVLGPAAADWQAKALEIAQSVAPGAGATPVQFVADETPYAGPLSALARWIEATPDLFDSGGVDDVIVAAVDTPLFSRDVALALRRLLHAKAEFEAVVPRVGDHLQPLASVWTARALARAPAFVRAGESSMYALVRSCRRLEPEESDLERIGVDPRRFRGVNDAADLDAIRAQLEG